MRTAAIAGNQNNNAPVDAAVATQRISATFQANIFKLDVPVVTLSINNNIKF